MHKTHHRTIENHHRTFGMTLWHHNGPYYDMRSHCNITSITLESCFDDTCVGVGCIPTLWF